MGSGVYTPATPTPLAEPAPADQATPAQERSQVEEKIELRLANDLAGALAEMAKMSGLTVEELIKAMLGMANYHAKIEAQVDQMDWLYDQEFYIYDEKVEGTEPKRVYIQVTTGTLEGQNTIYLGHTNPEDNLEAEDPSADEH